MPNVWTYPWTLASAGVETSCHDLGNRGIDAINLATHYHSVQSMQPRTPERLFQRYPGGWYVDSDQAAFDRTPIDPPSNHLEAFSDPLGEILPTANDHGLAVNAWTVCLHNSRLGSVYPEFAIQSAFGDTHTHGLCPSHPAVQEYLAAVVRESARQGVSQVQLESIGFQSAFHNHDDLFGHPKRHVALGTTGEVLLSQCFCSGCEEAAEEHRIDLDAAASLVRELVGEALTKTVAELPPLDTLRNEYGVLEALFDFRSTVIQRLVAKLQTASGDVPLSYYTMELQLGTDPYDLWPAGVELEALAEHLDRVLAICYVDNPADATSRIQTVSSLVDCPIDAGVTLDPSVIEDEHTFRAVVEALQGAIDGSVSVYHYGVAPEEQLEWIERTFT